jgi:hypothetical protein
MANRNKTVRISEENKEFVDEVKMEMFGTGSPSYGEIIKCPSEE